MIHICNVGHIVGLLSKTHNGGINCTFNFNFDIS